VSKYGKVLIQKIKASIWFRHEEKKEDNRNYKVQKEHTCQNLKTYAPPVSLLLWCKIMAGLVSRLAAMVIEWVSEWISEWVSEWAASKWGRPNLDSWQFIHLKVLASLESLRHQLCMWHLGSSQSLFCGKGSIVLIMKVTCLSGVLAIGI